ncbi:non-specific protein-tyrosine kinase [Acanthamoeba castellanii str. Neff]|uniref:non-specific serine/threonine protein kinase n=1 Tax=Acanthamoeba castellanii (strain ATCC 30010 / Neff) TaxID=1257118 RepID=L8H1B3_ACACF|nr:non-specific protein-tyrosine kinase [Acanthamoeba castellanii str. Neff]ELR19294.1 non-specific protein-tyrosine kinase [Acanthamoeba castellanii str. Neff]
MEIQFSSLSVGEGIKEGTSWFGGQLAVAIKKLDSTLVAADTPIVQRFLQKKLYEVKSLSHPNLVHVLDMVRNGDEAFLICEYVKDATPLHALLRDEEAAFPWPLRVKIAQQVSEAVAYLHKRGVHHQNLKPSNILLVGKDYASVKVGDLVFWGSVAAQAFSSATFGKGPLTRTLSTANLKVGTTYTTWVAPEPLNRKSYTDDADVYSFGLVLYSLLTRGSPPARTEKEEFQFRDHEELKKKLPADAPAELWELAAKCIDANPKVRPPFERINDALKAIYADLTAPAAEKKEAEGKGKEKEKEKKDEAAPEEKPKKEEKKAVAEEPKQESKKAKKATEEAKPEEAKKTEEKAKGKKEAKPEEEKKKAEEKPNGKEQKKAKKATEEAKPEEKKKTEEKAKGKKEAKPEEKRRSPTARSRSRKPEKEKAKANKAEEKTKKGKADDEKKPGKEETKKGKKAKA